MRALKRPSKAHSAATAASIFSSAPHPQKCPIASPHSPLPSLRRASGGPEASTLSPQPASQGCCEDEAPGARGSSATPLHHLRSIGGMGLLLTHSATFGKGAGRGQEGLSRAPAMPVVTRGKALQWGLRKRLRSTAWNCKHLSRPHEESLQRLSTDALRLLHCFGLLLLASLALTYISVLA